MWSQIQSSRHTPDHKNQEKLPWHSPSWTYELTFLQHEFIICKEGNFELQSKSSLQLWPKNSRCRNLTLASCIIHINRKTNSTEKQVQYLNLPIVVVFPPPFTPTIIITAGRLQTLYRTQAINRDPVNTEATFRLTHVMEQNVTALQSHFGLLCHIAMRHRKIWITWYQAEALRCSPFQSTIWL